MIRPPHNSSENDIWQRLVSDELNKNYIELPQYITSNLPVLDSTQRGLAWDTTLNKPVAWDGTSWNALY